MNSIVQFVGADFQYLTPVCNTVILFDTLHTYSLMSVNVVSSLYRVRVARYLRLRNDKQIASERVTCIRERAGPKCDVSGARPTRPLNFTTFC